MNDVDSAVESLVLGLASGTTRSSDITAAGAYAIARWILKTAATFELADEKDRRHIPKHIRDRIPERDYIPDGYVAFLHQSKEPWRELSACMTDAWINIDPNVMLTLKGAARLKFAIQYDRVVFGCSYVSCDKPIFVGIPGIHDPIYAKGALFGVDEELTEIAQRGFTATPFHKSFMNEFAAGLAFWHEGEGAGNVV